MVLDLGFRLQIACPILSSKRANAGYARRLAMELAAQEAGTDGILLTTDADSVVGSDWVARNLMAIRAGADIVCGRAIIDPTEATMIPAHLHADDALECELITLIDELAWALDPEPHDPPPRHTEASGASLAVTVDAYSRVGGIPDIATGEDRAFVKALWMIDAKVRHDPSICVTVSGRIDGRAEGGMADAIRRRMQQQDEFTDDQVEPALDAMRRYRLRQRVRNAWNGSKDPALATDLAVLPSMLQKILAQRYFGGAWADLEARSPNLRRTRVRFADLTREIAAAQFLLQRLIGADTLVAG
jgi:hypothetical protein